MRRLVRHGLAGVGAATFAVVAGVTVLGAPATTTVEAAPVTSVAPGQFVPVQLVPDTYNPADPVADAQRAATAEQTSREAERTRIAAATAEASYQRAAHLGAEGQAITQKSSEVKAAKKKAEAAEAKAAAAAEKARKAAIANQGYTPGTTDVHEIAQQILENKFSYGDDQFSCFSWIITKESNWKVDAENSSSHAYGLPQSLPGSKMASVASDWRTNPATQIIWGVQYMKSRYGSPCDAKSYWEGHGNY